MRKTLLSLAIAALSFPVLAEDTENTVSYYKEHEEERKAMMEKCKDNPGKYRDNPDCINAFEAQSRISLSSDNKGMPSI